MKDPVAQAGAAVLRLKAKPVTKKEFGSPALKKLIAHMKRTLAAEPFGVAIAAPQIGESKCIFVIAGKAFAPEAEEKFDERHAAVPGGHKGDRQRISPPPPDMVFINPEIIRVSKKKREMSEGCLSVRGKYGTVIRHEKASVKAYGEVGKAFTYQGSGLIAHIFQHECDHLEGILYIDKAKRLTTDDEREALREKFPA